MNAGAGDEKTEVECVQEGREAAFRGASRYIFYSLASPLVDNR